MIKPGIQENIRITEVSKDENNNVVFNFAQGKEVDMMEALANGDAIGGAEAARVLIWGLKGTGYSDAKIEGKRIVEHINEYKAFFTEILLQYFPKSEINFKSMWDNVGITKGEEIEELSSSQIELVGRNIINYFVEKMQEADLALESRYKFYRTSEAKTFITLKPSMFTNFGKIKADGFRSTWTTPFVESMNVPAEASKLKFSDFEKGLDKDGNKVSWDKSSAEPVKADETPSAGDEPLPF